VGDMTAKVDPNSGNITEYHTAVKIAFGVKTLNSGFVPSS